MAGSYRVRAYCGGPNTTSTTHTTEAEARAQADRWQQAMSEAQEIVVYGPRKTPRGDYEVYRVQGQATHSHHPGESQRAPASEGRSLTTTAPHGCPTGGSDHG